MTLREAHAKATELEKLAKQSKHGFCVIDVQGRVLRVERHGIGYLYSYAGEDVDYDTVMVLLQNR